MTPTPDPLREAYLLGWRDHEAGIAQRPPALAQPAPALDVERLAWALATVNLAAVDAMQGPPFKAMSNHDRAAAIAREYAALGDPA